ncbi:hypothetical protein BGX34_001346 [Mortierella sp. NVP85]|nr:hypothetical protein BGX34_001346 [Mortierella sp. NVP85]
MTQPPLPEPALAITACDSFEGQTLAIKLAKYLAKHHHDTKLLICLARDPEKCGYLKDLPNCKLVKISYDDPTSVAIAIRDIQTVVLVPEIEDKRVDWANSFVDVMTQENVVRCILISSIGTDDKREHLERFVRVEEKVKGSIKRWTILREGFPFQALFYWIPMMRDQGVLGMPIKPEIEFAPLELGNLGDALVSVIFPTRRVDCDDDQDQKNDCSKPDEEIFHSTAACEEALPPLSIEENDLKRFDGQIYTLTGPERTTGPKLVEELNRVLSYDSESEENEGESGSQTGDGPKPIVYKYLSRDETRAYLVNLRDKNRRPDSRPRFKITDLPGIHGALRLFRQATEALKSQQSASPVQPSSFQGKGKGRQSVSKADDAKDAEDDASIDLSAKLNSMDTCEDPEQLPLAEGLIDPLDPLDPKAPEESEHEDSGEPLVPETPESGQLDQADDEEPPKHRKPKLKAPIDAEVDLMLDLLDYIGEGRATFQSGDLEKVAGIKGADAKDFFEKYAEDFARGA